MKILSFDIGGTAIKYGILNENGEILELKETPTEANKGGRFVMDKVLSIINQYKDLDRIGVSTAGQVNSHSGEIIFASKNIPGWLGMKVKEEIQTRYDIKAFVENDVNCAALGEAYLGAGRGYDKFLCLAYGTGVGGAIICNKTIYRDLGYSSGEFGHMVTHVEGETCNCGSKGCYERYASTSALVRRVKNELNLEGNVNGRLIFKRVKEGDSSYIAVVNKWIDEVLIGLVNLIHIFNPSLIILGGGVMEENYVLDYIKENINERMLPSFQGVKIKGAELGNKAALVGISHIAATNQGGIK